MQNSLIQDFANKVGFLIPDSQKRRVLLPYLLGMAVGNSLVLKMGNEVFPATAYADAHLVNVQRAISRINEDMIIDVKGACESAKSMYIMRDRIFNGTPVSATGSVEFDFIAVALGLAPMVPVEIYQLMQETGNASSTVYAAATMLIYNLKSTGLIQL